VNERNLKRTLSTSVVDALKAQGHILVVKGGATALARELEDLMAPLLAKITPKIEPVLMVGGEVTSTFGHESIDEAVEEMVARLTRALMDSDHVEDVFAEDNVIQRDIFRTVRDGLLEPSLNDASGDDDPSIRVQLDTLGYVAATVSRLADPKTLRETLGRAAEVAMAHFTAYHHDARAATFVLQDDDPDGRLELEEAIADELTDLVEEGKVELPTIERRIDLGHALSLIEQRAAKPRIDAAGQKALLGTGCSASWKLEGGRMLRVTLTPLSDQDARNVDLYVSAFAREVSQIRGLSATPLPPPPQLELRGRKRPLPQLAASEDEQDLDEDEQDLDEDDQDLDEDEQDLDEDEQDLDEDEKDLDEDDQDLDEEGDEDEAPRDEGTTVRASAVEKAASLARATREKPEPRAAASKRAAPKRAAPKRAAPKRAAPKRAAPKASPRRAVKPAAAPQKAASSRKPAPGTKPAKSSAKPRKAPAKKR
jgi:hypothetical protein